MHALQLLKYLRHHCTWSALELRRGRRGEEGGGMGGGREGSKGRFSSQFALWTSGVHQLEGEFFQPSSVISHQQLPPIGH